MDLDTLLHHYFGTDDLDAVDAATFEAGQQRLAIDFGIERDPARRFAFWALMSTLGIAPDPAVAFKDPRERRAAEAYARLTDGAGEAPAG
ncbi:hypothetical protein BH10PSE12_BH10PSE12_11300 [soil metagenome]